MARMTFEPPERVAPPRVNFIPLIDVVLQIICFYLFVSAGVQSYQDTRVELPRMTSDALAGELPATVTINLGPDGAIDVNGDAVTMAELTARLLSAKASADVAEPATGDAGASAAAGAQSRLVVAIRADRRQRYGLLDQILQACRSAEIAVVTIRSISDSPVSSARVGP